MHALLEMMKTAFLIFLIFIVDVAVSQPSSPECAASFVAFTAQPSCALAVGNITTGTPSPEQYALACDDTLECIDLWRNTIRDCSEEEPGDLVQLYCATPTTNSNCGRLLLENVTFDALFGQYLGAFSETCTQSFVRGRTCSAECAELLSNTLNVIGCCWNEFFEYLPTLASFPITEDQADWVIGISALCGIDTTFCDNRPLPTGSMCDNWAMQLYNGSACGTAVSNLLTSEYAEGYSQISAIPGCPALFGQFAEACGSIEPTVTFFANVFGRLDRVQCSQHVQVLITSYFSGGYTTQNQCLRDYAFGRCSEDCRQALEVGITQLGCCFNDFIRIVIGNSDDKADQINYALLTNELFTFCGLQSPGFCEQPSVQYSDTALNCIDAANQVFSSDDFCTEYYREILQATSVGSVSTAAYGVCRSQQCRAQLPNFSDYLLTCSDLDENGIVQQDFEYLSTLANNTACRTNGSTSCAAILLTSELAQKVGSAFDSGGDCLSVFSSPPVCSPDCQELLQSVGEELGCCLTEFGFAFLTEAGFRLLELACGITGTRCNEIAINNNDPCIRAQEELTADSNCNSAFVSIANTALRITTGTTLNQANSYLEAICNDRRCAKAVSNYFTACQSQISNDPDLNLLQTDYTALACQQSDINSVDCYALSLTELTLAAATFAFDTTGSCESLLQTDGICSAACRSILAAAVNSSGCCLTEMSQNLLRTSGISIVSTKDFFDKCQIRDPGSCGDTGGANLLKGFNIIILLLFGVITMLCMA